MKPVILSALVVAALSVTAHGQSSGTLKSQTGVGINANKGAIGVNGTTTNSATGTTRRGTLGTDVNTNANINAQRTGTMPMQSSLDTQLNSRVQQQLRSNISNYNGSAHTIYSQNGEVTLQGTVRSRAEADQMEREARRVSGVTRVNNQLTIQSQ